MPQGYQEMIPNLQWTTDHQQSAPTTVYGCIGCASPIEGTVYIVLGTTYCLQHAQEAYNGSHRVSNTFISNAQGYAVSH